ncbi:2-oxo acid dehydrogenase subunit E2 [Salipiger sp. P9]|uniref:2-oxo acid dehydrogenase subunit E2 n=1 Tax=Salipiger pentaromativorans TaxID=2943193 RepID=UPI0021575990|nr:2-oxo acid dehydrogenase subunit E2 [Salipiger pentaromativorans]MCR8549964.1 2-oxo acid dehydrogenase subunit E2 [Salipiger pentaromativorans]
MIETIEIRVPDIGDFKDVPIVEVSVAIGDVLHAEDTVVVVESDKATLDIPTSHAGKIVELLVRDGDLVSEGTLIARMELSDSPDVVGEVAPEKASKPEAATPTSAQAPAPGPVMPQAPAEPAPVPPAADPSVHASPAIRHYARKLGVLIGEVAGTGPKGRILREDVEDWVKTRLAEPTRKTGSLPDLPDWPEENYAKFGPVAQVPLSRIAKISGPALARNSITIPHVCNFDKADVTDLESFRKTLNSEAGAEVTKITMLAFAVKACVSVLQAFPKFNSSLDGGSLVLKQYWNIGVAADTPDGLMVPVIKQADQKSVTEIATEMAELAALARAGKLKPEAMSGGTFTISSLGGIGGTGFTPIINAPQVAILGMTRAEIQPVWQGDTFQPRLIQPMSLSWDHRVVDGVAAAKFLQHLSRVLSDFRRVSI